MVAAVSAVLALLLVSSVPEAPSPDRACSVAAELSDRHSGVPGRVAGDVCRWAPLAVWAFGEAAGEGLCVMAWESHGNPDARLDHPAADGSIDPMVGLMQINADDIWGRQPVGMERWQTQRRWPMERIVEWLSDPVVNLVVAAGRQQAAGWGPWAAARLCGLAP